MSYSSMWKLRSNSTDFVGSNNGTDSNMTYSLGHAVFNDSNSKITTGYTFPIGSSNKSMMCVFSNDNAATDRGWMIAGGTDANAQAFGIFCQDVNDIFFHGNGASYDMTIDTDYPTSTWSLIAVTYDGTTIRGYLGGRTEVTKVAALNTQNSVAQTWLGARKNGDANGWYAGKMKDVIVTSDVWGQQFIRTMYAHSKGMLIS